MVKDIDQIPGPILNRGGQCVLFRTTPLGLASHFTTHFIIVQRVLIWEFHLRIAIINLVNNVKYRNRANQSNRRAIWD